MTVRLNRICLRPVGLNGAFKRLWRLGPRCVLSFFLFYALLITFLWEGRASHAQSGHSLQAIPQEDDAKISLSDDGTLLVFKARNGAGLSIQRIDGNQRRQVDFANIDIVTDLFTIRNDGTSIATTVSQDGRLLEYDIETSEWHSTAQYKVNYILEEDAYVPGRLARRIERILDYPQADAYLAIEEWRHEDAADPKDRRDLVLLHRSGELPPTLVLGDAKWMTLDPDSGRVFAFEANAVRALDWKGGEFVEAWVNDSIDLSGVSSRSVNANSAINEFDSEVFASGDYLFVCRALDNRRAKWQVIDTSSGDVIGNGIAEAHRSASTMRSNGCLYQGYEADTFLLDRSVGTDWELTDGSEQLPDELREFDQIGVSENGLVKFGPAISRPVEVSLANDPIIFRNGSMLTFSNICIDESGFFTCFQELPPMIAPRDLAVSSNGKFLSAFFQVFDETENAQFQWINLETGGVEERLLSDVLEGAQYFNANDETIPEAQLYDDYFFNNWLTADSTTRDLVFLGADSAITIPKRGVGRVDIQPLSKLKYYDEGTDQSILVPLLDVYPDGGARPQMYVDPELSTKVWCDPLDNTLKVGELGSSTPTWEAKLPHRVWVDGLVSVTCREFSIARVGNSAIVAIFNNSMVRTELYDFRTIPPTITTFDEGSWPNNGPQIALTKSVAVQRP